VTAAIAAIGNRAFLSLNLHRNYRVFFTGQVVSLAGSWMQNVALAWLVISLGGSPLAVGGLAAARFLPFTVVGLVAGLVVDRVDTRRLVMVTQAGAMTVSALLTLMTVTGMVSLPLVFVLAALGGVALVFDAPGRQALTYELVGPRELANAVALNSGLLNSARVVGPALAGIVIATAGIGWCFALNTVSFLAVLVALAVLRVDELHPVERERSQGLVAGLREGLAYIVRSRETAAILALVALVGLVGFNFNVLVPLLASDGLHVGAAAFGALAASFGFGALAGALLTATRAHAGWRALTCGAVGFSGAMLVLAWIPNALLAGGLLFLIGLCFTVFTANANALVQLRAPDRLRGRVIGLYLFAFVGIAPAGGLVTGWLVSIGGTQLAFSVAGIVGLTATIVLRQLHRRKVPLIKG
jgi:MFS family permease